MSPYTLVIHYSHIELYDTELDTTTIISRPNHYDYDANVKSMIKLVQAVGGEIINKNIEE